MPSSSPPSFEKLSSLARERSLMNIQMDMPNPAQEINIRPHCACKQRAVAPDAAAVKCTCCALRMGTLYELMTATAASR